MSIVPMRKLIIKPFYLGPYSRAIIVPAWWLKLNENPGELEVDLTLDSLVVKPVTERKVDDAGMLGDEH